MPNIEIIGFLEKSCCIVKSVQELFKQKPYADDIIITWNGDSYALSLTNKKKPYFRLISAPEDDNDDIKEIKKLLASLNIDTEVMLLDEFIEARQPETE